MFYVYILKSKKDGKCYFGSTIDLKKRLKLHNDGRVFSTKYRRPLILVYYEAYLSEKDARKREQMLKNYGQGITNIYKRISNSLGKKVQGK
jgi:putative endonuclease